MSRKASAMRAILWGGGIAGTLDILYAFFFYGARGVRPAVILQSIASGLLGRQAYRGGILTAALGLVLHFFIALTIAAVYYAASRRWATLRGPRVWLWGVAYGIAVYCVMNAVVLPISAFAGARPSSTAVITGIVVHMFFIGLPVALATKKLGR